MATETDKIFNDSVHGHIKMHPLLVDMIDTPEFQRLRNIKQMGGIYYVFPGASHNRFEHSIGVCHLAGELVNNLKAQGEDITSKDILCVQIAGLCHDLGHGPFSHLFEEVTMELSEKLDLEPEQIQISENLKNWKHEEQSGKMFDLLISQGIKRKMEDEHYRDEEGQKIKFETNDFKFIHELIEGPQASSSSTHWSYRGRTQDKSYLYEIVANKHTGIDVDKMDYISRDCLHLGMKSNISHKRFMMFARVCYNAEENKKQICMRDKEAINMYELFHSRYMLHYSVCHHRVKVAIETMITDALVAAENHFTLGDKTISEAVLDPETFVKLTDDILMEIMWSTNEELSEAKEIIGRIQDRKLYKCVGKYLFQTNELNRLERTQEKAVVRDWLKYIKTHREEDDWIKNEKIEDNEKLFTVKLVKLNYGKEEEDPIKHLRFYRKNNLKKSVKLDENEVSYMLPKNFSETKVMVFYKGSREVPPNLPLERLWEILKTVGRQQSSENVLSVSVSVASSSNIVCEGKLIVQANAWANLEKRN